MKKVLIAISIFVIIVCISGISILTWYKNSIKENSAFEISDTFIVEEGESTASIIARLEDERFLKSALATKIWLKFHPTTIQAGTFELNTYMNVNEIFLTLSDAIEETVWVTIPEGLRYDEIAEIWKEEIEGFSAVKFIELAENTYEGNETAEGFLFPDTYNVMPNITEQEALDLMMNTFDQKVGTIDYDTLILASIIEREAKSDDERATVAGILKKRLDTYGWLLQADATLLYEYKDWTKTITPEMKDSDSPYNTYVNPDLPPTPICNPGLESIEAVRNPETDTPYWFYLHEDDGTIHYAVTQEQHNQNIYNYLW